MGKKPIASVTYKNERISIKNSLRYIKCVLRPSCVVRGSIYGRFRGSTVNDFFSIERFNSRGQSMQIYQIHVNKESVYIRKDFNSHRIGLGHQHGRRFIVLGHQYGRRDVM